MSDPVELINAYRKASKLADRLRLADEIIRLIVPLLRPYVFGKVPEAAEDVMQEVLNSIADSLDAFKNDSWEDFRKWCFRIARRRIADYIRKAKRDKLKPLPFEELLDVIDDSSHAAELSAADKIDLNYALRLLHNSKPECLNYLWNYYVTGMDYAEIAEDQSVSYDNARMKVGRCLETARALVV